MLKKVNYIRFENNAQHKKVAIVVADYYEEICERLTTAAVDTLLKSGASAEDIDVVYVPGAFELPLAAKKLITLNKYQGIIALGVIIRGETPHFDYVATECAHGLATVSLQHDVAVSFGVLTVDNKAQADARTTDQRNKGAEAAQALIKMMQLMELTGDKL